MKLLRVLVFGGRDYSDAKRLFWVLNEIHQAARAGRSTIRRTQRIICIIHGNARGADALAGNWAAKSGVICEVYPADWDQHGKAAGPIRNQKMHDEGKPDLAVGFPGGRGTAHMASVCRAAGTELMEIK